MLVLAVTGDQVPGITTAQLNWNWAELLQHYLTLKTMQAQQQEKTIQIKGQVNNMFGLTFL